MAKNQNAGRYDEVLPLECQSCGRHWDQMVRTEEMDVQCSCGGRCVRVIPPAKILDSNRANHYNRPVTHRRRGRKRREESSEPEVVLRAGVMEPESFDIEIIEEIG